MLPTDLFPNLSTDGTSITIPLTDLDGLTASEADPATGDGRELARILVNSMVTKYLEIPQQDRPARFVASKANPQGIGVEQIRQTYTLGFDVLLDSAGVAMVSEA
ncbi:hypothetical protein AA637_11850 [Cyanobacterium sp. HL-69]|uniref:hypothetical protein n=1 Tax=Cyanobacterium sp. HL-69 TaxID=2054282 RepID=UPI000CA3A3B3|nr:hypothetical protein AA637_11850 [Cyanobacterium sp. HL-69]